MSQSTTEKHVVEVRLPQAKTETASWRVKGNGVVYTTSKEIVESAAWQRSFSAARKVRLKATPKR